MFYYYTLLHIVIVINLRYLSLITFPHSLVTIPKSTPINFPLSTLRRTGPSWQRSEVATSKGLYASHFWDQVTSMRLQSSANLKWAKEGWLIREENCWLSWIFLMIDRAFWSTTKLEVGELFHLVKPDLPLRRDQNEHPLWRVNPLHHYRSYPNGHGL